MLFEAFVQRHLDLETFEAEPRGTAAPAEEDAEGWDLARQEAVAALQQKVEAGFVTTQALAPPQSGESARHPREATAASWECRPTGPFPGLKVPRRLQKGSANVRSYPLRTVLTGVWGFVPCSYKLGFWL
jgi:hypothetical protein